MQQEAKPSPHLNGKFEVIGVLPGEVVFNKETVDLRIITAEKADELLKAGFPYLKVKEKTKLSQKVSEE
jgi:hypothetical protein